MAILFVLAMVSAILLALSGSLPFWSAAVIALACLAGLAVIGSIEQKEQRLLKRRCRQLKASWGILTSHLGGLPLPLETNCSLFLLSDQLVLDTEHDQQRIPLEKLKQILLVTVEQIRKLSDRQLSELLGTGGIRTFSSVREKIRRKDRLLNLHGNLMIVYQKTDDETALLILSTRYRMPALIDLMKKSLINDKTNLIQPNSQKMISIIHE